MGRLSLRQLSLLRNAPVHTQHVLTCIHCTHGHTLHTHAHTAIHMHTTHGHTLHTAHTWAHSRHSTHRHMCTHMHTQAHTTCTDTPHMWAPMHTHSLGQTLCTREHVCQAVGNPSLLVTSPDHHGSPVRRAQRLSSLSEATRLPQVAMNLQEWRCGSTLSPPS